MVAGHGAVTDVGVVLVKDVSELGRDLFAGGRLVLVLDGLVSSFCMST